MQISLTHPELQRFIEDQIKEGLFASASDLVEAAVARLMLDPELDEKFDDARLASVRKSQEQIIHGHVETFNQAADELRRKHLAR